MMCKDCVHFGICTKGFPWADEKGGGWCESFKDKSRYIELPCKVGQMVFFCDEVYDEDGKEKFAISAGEVVSFSLQKEGLWAYCRYKSGLSYWHFVENYFGKTVFFTREEAEKALAERSVK